MNNKVTLYDKGSLHDSPDSKILKMSDQIYH